MVAGRTMILSWMAPHQSCPSQASLHRDLTGWGFFLLHKVCATIDLNELDLLISFFSYLTFFKTACEKVRRTPELQVTPLLLIVG